MRDCGNNGVSGSSPPGGEPGGEEPDMAATLEAVPSTKTVEN
jgi:hypothetical protein